MAILPEQGNLLGTQTIAIHGSSGGTIVNTGMQNVDLCQPNQIFATRDARDIDRMCQIVGGKLDTRMGINPQA